jgi:hypothetical protein
LAQVQDYRLFAPDRRHCALPGAQFNEAATITPAVGGVTVQNQIVSVAMIHIGGSDEGVRLVRLAPYAAQSCNHLSGQSAGPNNGVAVCSVS